MLPDLVSIVVPCFNAEHTIAETIDSALRQTYEPCEVILVDDGSTDDSVKVVQKYGNLVRLEMGPNRGASFARNRGTRLAMGEFIQYLDADDLLVADTLERRIEAIRGTGADVAYTDWQKFEQLEGGSYSYLEKVERDIIDVDTDPEVACATHFWAPPAAILYRRDIVNRIGGWREDLPVIQDARFLFDAAHHGAEFIRVPVIGAYYRTSNRESLSNRDAYRFVLDVMHNAIQIQELWTKDQNISGKRKEALRGIYDYVARDMFEYDEEQFENVLQKIRELSREGSSAYVTLAGMFYKTVGIRRARNIMKFATRVRDIAVRRTGNPAVH